MLYTAAYRHHEQEQRYWFRQERHFVMPVSDKLETVYQVFL